MSSAENRVKISDFANHYRMVEAGTVQPHTELFRTITLWRLLCDFLSDPANLPNLLTSSGPISDSDLHTAWQRYLQEKGGDVPKDDLALRTARDANDTNLLIVHAKSTNLCKEYVAATIEIERK